MDICLLAQDEASHPEVEYANDACKISSIQLMREGIRTLCQVAHSVNRHLGPFMNISQNQEKLLRFSDQYAPSLYA